MSFPVSINCFFEIHKKITILYCILYKIICVRLAMRDFLTFQTFITPTLLIVMYYIGAILIPLFSWYFIHWIKTVYKAELENKTTFKQRSIVYSVFFISFFSMEIFWRVMFEFFIAYFDMHDALMKLT